MNALRCFSVVACDVSSFSLCVQLVALMQNMAGDEYDSSEDEDYVDDGDTDSTAP